MYVCVCNAIKEKDLRAAAKEQPTASTEEIYAGMDAEPVCGACLCYADQVVDTERAANGSVGASKSGGGINLYSSASLKPA